MQMNDTHLVCGGFCLGDPAMPFAVPAAEAAIATALARARQARLFLPPRLFVDLPAALSVAAIVAADVHGLWLPASDLPAVLDEEEPGPGVQRPAVLAILRRAGADLGPPAASHCGWDVLGFAGDDCWSWRILHSGPELAARYGIATSATDFLPDEGAAREVAGELNDDDLGPPVIWRCWWRTVHAPAGADSPGRAPER
jgi:hypothetical protein